MRLIEVLLMSTHSMFSQINKINDMWITLLIWGCAYGACGERRLLIGMAPMVSAYCRHNFWKCMR